MAVTARNPVSKKKTGRPANPEPTRPIQIRLPESVVEAIERMADDNRRTRVQEIVIAIEDRLQEEGYWPYPSDEEGKG